MRVRMKTKIGGYRNGVEWPAAGQCIDVPAYEAADLIAARYAEEAHDADENDEAIADSGAAPVGDSDPAAAGHGSEEAPDDEEAQLTPVDTPADDEPEAAKKPAAKTKKA